MRKTLVALATVATLAFSAASPAHAQRALGAAIAGGLIGGAIVGGAVAANPYYYGPGPYYGYGPGPYYGGPAYVAAEIRTAATGSVSASGMATPGASAACRFATELVQLRPFIFIKSGGDAAGSA